jgi:hypothetical protein
LQKSFKMASLPLNLKGKAHVGIDNRSEFGIW